MVTREPPKLPREGSIPSRPARWGDSSTGELYLCTVEIGVPFPAHPPGPDRRSLRMIWVRQLACQKGGGGPSPPGGFKEGGIFPPGKFLPPRGGVGVWAPRRSPRTS